MDKNKISTAGRLLYMLIRTRYEIGLKGKNTGRYEFDFKPDDNGDVYITYPREEMGSDLNACINTVTKAVKELTGHGFIWEERQGLGLPNRIYMTDKKFIL